MYGKIFDSMYDSTISANWQAMITFQQMIVLKDQNGVVDMTPPALSRRTGIPLEIIEAGIAYLEAPDPYSRTPDHEGRRIVRIDDSRPWGWIIVNHKLYREMSTRADKREYDKKRYQASKSEKPSEKSEKEPKKVEKPEIPQDSTDSTYTDTDTDTKEDKESKPKKKNQLIKMPSQLNQAAWSDWIDYKKQIKKNYKTERGIQTAMNQLAELTSDQQQACIDSSIANEYQGFFVDKFRGFTNGNQNNQKQETIFERNERLAKDLKAQATTMDLDNDVIQVPQ